MLSSAASHRNIFILRQAESVSDRSSALEINLPPHMNSIATVVTDTHKALFRQQGSSSVFKADRLAEMVFLDLLASMRTAGWTIFSSNAYYDSSGKTCIKTFYFSEDVYMSKLNSIEQTLKQLKLGNGSITTSGLATATDEEVAAASSAHEELMAAANDPTANLPFMAKLKIVSDKCHRCHSYVVVVHDDEDALAYIYDVFTFHTFLQMSLHLYFNEL